MSGCPEPAFISDAHDPRVAPFAALSDRGLRRPAGGDPPPPRFVAESMLVVRRVVELGLDVEAFLLTAEAHARLADELAASDAPRYVASRSVLEAIAGFDVHRGVLASVRRPAEAEPGDVVADARVVAVLEGINDQANLGAIFRNAAALGVDAVLLCPRCCDPLYRRTVRVSMGASLAVPWARLGPWPAALEGLAGRGFEVVAFTPDGEQELRRSDSGAGSGRVGLLFGAEGPGLSEPVLNLAHRRVRIPMNPRADSLNVAAATAIAFHHFAAPDPPTMPRHER